MDEYERIIQDVLVYVRDLEERVKESQRRILTNGEVFPAEKADQLVRDAWT